MWLASSPGLSHTWVYWSCLDVCKVVQSKVNWYMYFYNELLFPLTMVMLYIISYSVIVKKSGPVPPQTGYNRGYRTSLPNFVIQFAEKKFGKLDHLGPVCRIRQTGIRQTGPNLRKRGTNLSSKTPKLQTESTEKWTSQNQKAWKIEFWN